MQHVKMYTTQVCPYCLRAKALLKQRGVQAIEETKSCPEFTTEAIRVLKKSPRWVPGQNNGTFLKSWREIPIKLSVD